MNYVVEPGAVEVMVDASSDDLPLNMKIEIMGEITEISRDKKFEYFPDSVGNIASIAQIS